MSRAIITKDGGMLWMSCKVEVGIRASADRVWDLLTDAEGYPRWNPTITLVEGRIRDGERLCLHVPGTKRTFRPRVSNLVPNGCMTWSDGIALIFKGVRTFRVTPRADDVVDFEMTEVFSGVVFALTKRLMPDFGPIFEQFASGLKREAEREL